MGSVTIRCQMCGQDNMFPQKYAGMTLACAHCGDALAVPVAVGSSRITRTVPFLVRGPTWLVCWFAGLAAGMIGGVFGAIYGTFHLIGNFGFVFVLLTTPLGALVGAILGLRVGGMVGRTAASRFLGVAGVVLGLGVGVALNLEHDPEIWARMNEGRMALIQWAHVSLKMSLPTLACGLLAAWVDSALGLTKHDA